jgi:hypothetical protein
MPTVTGMGETDKGIQKEKLVVPYSGHRRLVSFFPRRNATASPQTLRTPNFKLSLD